jgi:sodium-coupled monocarboxylate transporter 8/12
MSKPQIGTVDYVVLVIILILSVAIGLYYGLKDKIIQYFKQREQIKDSDGNLKVTQNNEDGKLAEFQSAKSSMGIFPIAMSLMASSFSATGLVGNPTEVYQYGIDQWILAFGFATPPLLGAFVFGPFFARINSQTVFEYILMRYKSRPVKLIANVCYMLRTFMATGFITLGPATAISYIMNLDQNISIAIIGFVGTFYTAVGGMKAVIWTDVFQSTVMLVSVGLICVKGIIDVDGFENFWHINEKGARLDLFKWDPNPFIRQSFWSYYFGGAFYFSMNYCFDQQMIQV